MIVEIIEIIVIISLVALLIYIHKKHSLPYERDYPILQWISHFMKLGILCLMLGVIIGSLGTAIGLPSIAIMILSFGLCFLLGWFYPVYPRKIWRKKND